MDRKPAERNWERRLAALCASCPVCSQARSTPHGVCYWIVRGVEGKVCPACRAYERTTGRKAHDSVPDRTDSKSREEK